MKIKYTLLAVVLNFGIVASTHASLMQIDFSGFVTDAADLGLTAVFTGGSVISGAALTGVIKVDTASINPSIDSYTSSFNWVSSAITINGFTYRTDFPTDYLTPTHTDYARAHGDFNDRKTMLVDGQGAVEYDGDGNKIFTTDNYLVLHSGSMLGDGLPSIENLLSSLTSGLYFQSLSYNGQPNSFAAYETYCKLWGTIDKFSVSKHPVVSVAEPYSALLFALGVLGLCLARRKLLDESPSNKVLPMKSPLKVTAGR